MLNIAQHLDSHQTLGVDWPTDAVYGVVYHLRAWPNLNRRDVAFFTDADSFRKWYVANTRWSRLEDNYFEINSKFVWDLGPNPSMPSPSTTKPPVTRPTPPGCES